MRNGRASLESCTMMGWTLAFKHVAALCDRKNLLTPENILSHQLYTIILIEAEQRHVLSSLCYSLCSCLECLIQMVMPFWEAVDSLEGEHSWWLITRCEILMIICGLYSCCSPLVPTLLWCDQHLGHTLVTHVTWASSSCIPTRMDWNFQPKHILPPL